MSRSTSQSATYNPYDRLDTPFPDDDRTLEEIVGQKGVPQMPALHSIADLDPRGHALANIIKSLNDKLEQRSDKVGDIRRLQFTLRINALKAKAGMSLLSTVGHPGWDMVKGYHDASVIMNYRWACDAYGSGDHKLAKDYFDEAERIFHLLRHAEYLLNEGY